MDRHPTKKSTKVQNPQLEVVRLRRIVGYQERVIDLFLPPDTVQVLEIVNDVAEVGINRVMERPEAPGFELTEFTESICKLLHNALQGDMRSSQSPLRTSQPSPSEPGDTK